MADDYEDPLKGFFLPEEGVQHNKMPTYDEAMGALSTEGNAGNVSLLSTLARAGYGAHGLVQGAGRGIESLVKGQANPISGAYDAFIKSPIQAAARYQADDANKGQIQVDDAGNEYGVSPSKADAAEAALSPLIFGVGSAARLGKGIEVLSQTPKTAAAGAQTIRPYRKSKEQDRLGFYSPSLEAIKSYDRPSHTVNHFKNQILGRGGKLDELNAVGWDRAFPDPTAKVTRQEVEDFLRDKRVKTRETILSEDYDRNTVSDDYEIEAERKYIDEQENERLHSNYDENEDGLEELVIEDTDTGEEIYRGPGGDDVEEQDRVAWRDSVSSEWGELDPSEKQGYGVLAPQYQSYFPDFEKKSIGDQAVYSENLYNYPKDTQMVEQPFTAGHWESDKLPNLFGHTRTADFTGKRELSQVEKMQVAEAKERAKSLYGVKDKERDLVKALMQDQRVADIEGHPDWMAARRGTSQHDRSTEDLPKKLSNITAGDMARSVFRDDLEELEKNIRTVENAGNIKSRYLGELQSDWGADVEKNKGITFSPEAIDSARLHVFDVEDKFNALNRDYYKPKGLGSGDESILDLSGLSASDRSQKKADIDKLDSDLATSTNNIGYHESRIAEAERTSKKLQNEIDGLLNLNSEEARFGRADSPYDVEKQVERKREQIQNRMQGSESSREAIADEQKKLDNLQAERRALHNTLPKLDSEASTAWRENYNKVQLSLQEARNALKSAEGAPPAGPHTGDTKTWLDYLLKRSLIDAAESGVERLYFPEGNTVQKYTYGDLDGQTGFYGGYNSQDEYQRGMVVPRLQSILKRGGYDVPIGFSGGGGQPINETMTAGLGLDPLNPASSSDANIANATYPYLDMTEELREQIQQEGFPLFARPDMGAAGAFLTGPVQGAFEKEDDE